MSVRQQLILLVLALATVSTCTVAFALAMNLSRNMAVATSVADVPRMPEPADAERGPVWQLPPTPLPQVSPTPSRAPTPTNTRVPTWTPSPTYTPTATRVPTDTPVPSPTPTPLPPPVSEAPTVAPIPAVPTPTATPEFPFLATLDVFDTGTPQMTRVTGMVWKVVNENLALYDGQPGYQIRLVSPNGSVHLSDVSGLGGTDSTCVGCGDNQRMNMKVEFRPYIPGTYHVTLVQGEKQVSPEVTFDLAANPQQYVHFKFVPWE